ncbi:uncharacterized protein LOC118457404 [Anopheles albimanus]|uniref:Uncharacterized protein n=1 Tax=Anopheles albimanus TaxID=7167 RepID=A0A8W7K3B1_ANOAL|nr:uncharacterized protein LOC118457404 [Anopheles albimanus]
MAPILQQQRGKQQRLNYSIYVQQLFKDFLTRNSRNRENGAPRPIVPENNKDLSCRQEEPLPRRKQPGIFDRAVYARFERATHGQEALIRCEPTSGMKTGLMKWIDQQRSQQNSQQRQQSHVSRRPTRADDYLNLPSNFFSGSDQMKLSFDVCDKTVGNVTCNFIPPATSTPFERMNSLGISGVLSDPDEFQPTQGRSSTHRTSNVRTSIGWEDFLQNVQKVLASALDNIDETILEKHRADLKQIMLSEIQLASIEPKKDENRCAIPMHPIECSAKEMETFYRPSWKDHSLLSNYNFDLSMQRKKSEAGMPIQTSGINYKSISSMASAENHTRYTTDRFTTAVTTTTKIPTYRHPTISYFDETGTPTGNSIMATPEDAMLLTASPPSPSLEAVPANSLFEERSFFFDQTRTDDSLIAKLDELLGNDGDSPIIGSARRMDYNFDFPSQVETMPMEMIFSHRTRRLQHHNEVNQTWMIDKASPFHLTPDDTMGATFSDDLF